MIYRSSTKRAYLSSRQCFQNPLSMKIQEFIAATFVSYFDGIKDILEA
jgi:hypothetical protein